MSAGATSMRFVDAAGAREEDRTLAHRIVRRVAIAHVIANAMGAIDVFLLLWFVLPSPDHGAVTHVEIFATNALAFGIFVPITFVTGTVWGYRSARPLRRFLLEDRPPAEEERIGVLRHPLRCALVGAALWIAASVLGAVVNAASRGRSPSMSARRSSWAG
jgi:hypothetical protein